MLIPCSKTHLCFASKLLRRGKLYTKLSTWWPPVFQGCCTRSWGKKAGTQPLGNWGEPLMLKSWGVAKMTVPQVGSALALPCVDHGGPRYTKVIPDATEPNCYISKMFHI